MAYKVRNIYADIVQALVRANNDLVEENVGSFFHADITSVTSGTYTAPVSTSFTIATANATDTATATTLVNDEKVKINVHFADTYGHDSAVSAQVATAVATDLATALTLANALKAARNTHNSASNVHFNNDGTNVTAAADATDEASLVTLVNEIKVDHNAHIISAPPGAMIQLVAP